jgi:hypothetical protein
MAAGTLAENAVNTLRHELGRLFDDGFRESPGDYGHVGFNTAEHWRSVHRLYLRPALENARVYADAIGQRESAGQPGASVSSPVSTQAEAVDDEYAAIARLLDGKTRRVLWCMRNNNTDKFVEGLPRRAIADELKMTIDAVAEALEVMRNVGKAHGKTLYHGKPGCKGKVWLEPDGLRVAEHCTPADVIAVALKKRA